MTMRKRCLSLLVAFSVMLSVFAGFSVPAYAVGESGTTAVGWGTTFYVTTDGTLWGFGKNAENLIPGGGDYVDEPQQIMSDNHIFQSAKNCLESIYSLCLE